MSKSLDTPKPAFKPRGKSPWRWVWRVGAILLVAGGGYWFLHRPQQSSQDGTTFRVQRGPLRISVLESGTFEAMESQEIKSEVQGQTKILSIVDEGYFVTQEDVDNGKVLCELDSKDLVDRQTAQELEYQNSVAAYTESEEEFKIQQSQNDSDITTAELAVKFARMDFEKYMGVDAAKQILTQLGIDEIPKVEPPDPKELDELLNAASANKSGDSDSQKELLLTPMEDLADEPIDFSKYADEATLGDGDAKQMLRKLENDSVLAEKELKLSETQFEGTQRLAKKDFVTTNDVETERLKVERNEIAKATAETAKRLYMKYEFLKQSEKLLSDYREALRKLDRARKLAFSKMAQAEAKRKSAEARYNLQAMRRQELKEQIEKCKIRAKAPGLVVYGGGDDWRGDDQIQEGATIRERQKIITIPDMRVMAVKVKIHEAAIKNVEKGQKATIHVEAYPDMELTGEVVKVAILPDAQNRWMNPELKVYETKLSIDGSHDWIKPGMTAQVDILVKELPDVVFVPIQAVSPLEGKRVCYVVHFGSVEKREVETGESSNEYIEIKSGLKEGEQVLLRAPVIPEEADKAESKDKEGKGKKDKPAAKEKARDAQPPPPSPDAGQGPQ